MSKAGMTLAETKFEALALEKQVDLAVQQFRERCGLEEWQVTVSWGLVKVSANNGPASDAYMAIVGVRL
jgi:hypothetical protein